MRISDWSSDVCSSDLTPFTHFAAIDWSGAVGPRQKGLAVALCTLGSEAPVRVRPGHVWSRGEVLGWLDREMPRDTLVGLDFGPSLPFVDAGAFFPGWSESPADARGLWELAERLCADEPHLSASPSADPPPSPRRSEQRRVGT